MKIPNPIKILKGSKNGKDLEKVRHSLAHLLAAAVLEIYPDAKPTIGPSIENGFYYDFEFQKPITDKDLSKIEEKMRELLPDWSQFTSREVAHGEAEKIFAHNQYKLELIEEIVGKGEKITLYTCGGFTDLCRGGHVENPSKEIAPDSFKLSHIAGAYWRGDEKNKMLTRIYGLAFENGKDLADYEKMMEEAKKRDHRVLGQQLEIFTIADEVGAGLVLWLPKGTLIRQLIEQWAIRTEKEWGYQHISTPHITKSKLFEISGHLPYYKDDLYAPFEIEGEQYYLKPMNCPFAHMIYKSRVRSYREMPVRLAEYGQVYRYERSGTLHGLMRSRGFCQNDAHIYVRPEDAVAEFVRVLKMHEYYYDKLGIKDWWIVLGVRDPKNLRAKYHGDDAMWEEAEKLTREALDKAGVRYEIEEGGAAHYGPKGDIYIKSVIGKEYAIGTTQLDLYMPKRFGLTYVEKDGKEKTPYVIHRAPLGSHERMIGFLLEHYGGNFPFWLSPVQAKVLPITDTQKKFAEEVHEKLLEAGIRAEIDTRAESLGKKIRDAKMEKIPYLIVIGEKEQKEGKVMLESRDSDKNGEGYKINKLIEKLAKENKP